MADLIYWTTRIGLVIAWMVVAGLIWRRRHESPRLGARAATFAGLFASVRAWPWNYWFLEAARAGLKQGDVYDDRFWFKLALAAALLAGVVLFARFLARLAPDPPVLGCWIGLGFQGLLLAIETLSLDDLLPECLLQQPWRYLVEGACATLAIVSLLQAGPHHRAEQP